jgi:hypothetical protein
MLEIDLPLSLPMKGRFKQQSVGILMRPACVSF